MDILALSFWSNSTRSGTLSFGNGFDGGGNMSFLDGVNNGHHTASHHGFKKDKLEEFTLINTFYMEQYAYLLERLKNMKEGSSNVLENSMILFGSNISTGQSHNGKNVPIILSGNAGGRLKSGRHISAKNQELGDLHRSILDYMDVDAKIGKGDRHPQNLRPLNQLSQKNYQNPDMKSLLLLFSFLLVALVGAKPLPESPDKATDPYKEFH